MPSTSTTAQGRMPVVVWVLAAAAFLMGTTEFVIAGLLPDMAADLDVSTSRAGLMITVFAIGMIIGGPAMALATLRLPQRRTVILSLAVFRRRARRRSRQQLLHRHSRRPRARSMRSASSSPPPPQDPSGPPAPSA